MASMKKKKEALEAMIKSGVHGQRWPTNVYAIALYNHENYFIVRNTSKREHAEVHAIGHFKGLLKRRQLQSREIKLFISASPCGECSQKIITFLETAKCHHGVDLKIEVVFSAFYRIRRPSCNRRNPVCRDPRHFPSYDDHWSQLEGLKSLKAEPGVVLRMFNQQNCHKLRSVLGAYNIDYSCRKKEDKSLKKDFQDIVGGRTTSHRTVSPCQLQSPGAVGSSAVDLHSAQCLADMTTDCCLINISTDDCLENMPTDDCLVNISTDDCLENMPTDDCLENISTDDCLENMPTDDCLENMSTDDCLVNISTNDCLVNISTNDCLVNISTDDCLVNMSTDDCLVNMFTDESCVHLLTAQRKAVDLKLCKRSRQTMLWIITAIFILSLTVLAIIITQYSIYSI